MNFKKLISLFLAVLMLCGVLAGLPVMTASAEEVVETTPDGETVTETTVIPSTPEELQEHYYTTVYSTPEEKLATMEKMTEKYGYAIYADEQSGEVAVKDTRTGQILFSNPYDIGTSNATDDVKRELMSQIIVNYGDVTKENSLYFYSFDQAAIKNQITVRNIKNGIRVEYTIGRAEARHLLPEVIEKERFETMILKPMEESYGMTIEEAKVIAKDWGNPMADAAHEFNQFYSYFMLQDLDACELDAMKEAMLNSFPITEKMDVYVLDSKTPENVKAKLEQRIKEHCPDYSFEELDYDHQLTEHVSTAANPPLFKMALEYTLTEDGFSVRLPANGIRFNESAFKLHGIEILPFLGAGNITYDGYSFMPDGSGTLFSFEDMRDLNNAIVTPKVYGEDYAYHKLTATYQQATRYPVYGVVENTRYYDCTIVNDVTGEEEIVTISGVIYDKIKKAKEDGTTLDKTYATYEKYLNSASQIVERIEDRGFAAFVEEGDALASLEFHHEGSKHLYDGISIICNPRPSDEFNLADAISVGANATVTRTTERKYVGNYKVHIVMLSDEDVATKAVEEGKLEADEWYEATWLGMAFAYRDFLTDKGVLTPLTEDDVSEDIPLYIESFGAMETIEKILSIPMEVTRPLTSAQDILTMYNELSKDEDGNDLITNINFKLTGYANGGMYATIPYGLKWEKAVSEDVSMQELFNEAAKTDGQLSLFPEFDFTYVTTTDTFDGFSMRKHAVRTIDDVYAYKREYMATQQRYAGYFYLAVSPAYFSRFYEKLMDKYLQYDNVTGISVSTLGNSLNSDFDEDEPYNREDSKGFVKQALAFISGANDNTMEVMVDGGNAYTWEYVDHILGAPLDSSRYIQASYSVPFLGVVLHGNKNFTGAPLNMEGDVNYAKLKAIENGASIYFTLSYQNTQNLKEDYNLSKYYSVRYDIWYDDVIEIYTELNDVLADVQTMSIVDHQFLSGMRVPDTDELDRDLSAEFDAIMDFQGNQQAFLDQMKADSVADARKQVSELASSVVEHINAALTKYRGQAGAALKYIETNGDYFAENFSEYMNVKLRYDAIMADANATEEEKVKISDELTSANKALDRAIRAVAAQQVGIRTSTEEIATLIENAELARDLIDQTDGRPQSIVDEVDATIAATKAELQEMMGTTYEYSIGNLEVSTFLYLHYAYLNYVGDQETPAGKDSLETMYNLFNDEKYGIYAEEVDFLRYSAANRDLTDAEIIAKYNLTAGTPSKDALAQYVLELLGDSYEFDPALITNGGAEAAILDFFKNTFSYDLKTGYRDIGKDNGEFLTYFPINSKRSDGKSNAKAITALRDKIVSELNTKLIKPMTPTADGSYDLDTMYTTLGITEDELVASIKTLIEESMAVKVNVDKNEYPVEYLTPETMEADIRNYIRTYYYYSVMDKVITKDIGEATLPVLLTNSQTSSSMELLASLRIKSFGTIAADGKYATLVSNYIADKANVDAAIANINNNLTPYGDQTEALREAYLIAFAKAAVAGDKDTHRLDAKESADRTELRAKAEELLAATLPTISNAEGLDAVVAAVVALHADYEMKEDYDIQATSEDYVYYTYLATLAEKTNTASFYYDASIAEMDAAIVKEVEAKKAAILAKLGPDADAIDFYQAVMESLAETNPETGKSLVHEFVESTVEKVTLTPDSTKGTTKDYILRLYCYRLLNSVDEYALGDVTDIQLTIDKTDTNLIETAINNIYKYVGEQLPDLIKAARANVTVRGNMPNYSIESFMTEEEINVLVDDIIDRQLIKLSFVSSNPDRELLRPQVLKIVKYALYERVVKERLSANKEPTFPFYEIYAGSLEEADAALYDLMHFHATEYAGKTEEEFNNFYKATSGLAETEEDEETSRYLSDDGRIVAVSYGTKNASGTYDKYKTFVLNYNNFSVNVVYDEVTYTIPAYGYVVVMHDNP